MSDFEAQIRNERPEDEQNPVLIKELATIRFNYYLTTFKEVFNDVIEERRHVAQELRASSNDDRGIMSREYVNQLKTEDLFKSQSQSVLNESRFAGRSSVPGGNRKKKDFATSIMSSASLSTLP